jgi:osmoprotectant transport system permease protein
MRLVQILILFLLCLAAARAQQRLEVGSKRFTESYILGEILSQTARQSTGTDHREGLGNTAILVQALRGGSIDLYPEYLGTIELEILRRPIATGSLETVNHDLAPLGLGAAIPFGFENTYALAVRAESARSLNLHTISDLAKYPELRLGFSQEFLGRADGWIGLRGRYSLGQSALGLDHGLAYEALAQHQVDVIDIYSTDAKIARDQLVTLRDDLHFFPSYQALVLYRLDVPKRFPLAWKSLESLQGRIDVQRMIGLNGAVELEHRTFGQVAAAFLAGGSAQSGDGEVAFWRRVFGGNFWSLTAQHILLVVLSVGAALMIGIPLGTIAAYLPKTRTPVMLAVGVLQTVPALALLAFLIPITGRIGTLPALLALFIYALLPIVRNTCAGLLEVPAGLREAARALGLSGAQRLTAIELPLARRVILAGVKTATVISVGTATIAAFIGAGGYGQRITVGLALNDNAMLLAGAIPAALLALLVELLFDGIDRFLVRDTVSRSSA